jgi:hypothetical protein
MTDQTQDQTDLTIQVDPPPKAPRGRKAEADGAAPKVKNAKGDPATIRHALELVQTLLDGPRRSQDEKAAMLEAAGVTVGPAFNTYAATGHGIRATGTAGEHGALSNWCNAARRRLMED